MSWSEEATGRFRMAWYERVDKAKWVNKGIAGNRWSTAIRYKKSSEYSTWQKSDIKTMGA